MNCEEVRRYIDVYIDGEFDSQDSAELEGHVIACLECRQLVDGERQFREALRGKLSPIPAPSHLRESVLEQLEGGGSRTSRPSPVWSRAAVAALAAGIALTLWWPFGQLASTDSDPAGEQISAAAVVPATAATQPYVPASMARTSAPPSSPAAPAGHGDRAPVRPRQPFETGASLADYQRLQADVRGGETDIRRYMATRVSFEPQVPLLDGDGVRLLGARQVLHHGRPGVLFIYAVDGDRVSIVQSAATAQELQHRGLSVERERTLTRGRYVWRGMRHTVVTELGPSDVSRLLRAHTPR